MATLADDSGTLTQGGIVGTPSYMPPEQAKGQLDQLGPHSDVYALGAMLYELIAARPPFEGDSNAAMIRAHALTPPPRVAEVRPGLVLQPAFEQLLDSALAKKPADRFNDAVALLRAMGHTGTVPGAILSSDLPEALAEGGYKAFILMRRDASNQANPRFRILVVTRGESAVQSIVLEGSALELPKFKVVEKVDFGTIMHAQKPTPAYKEGLEELAYRNIPLE